MQQLIDIRLRLPFEVGKSLYSQLALQVEKKTKTVKGKTDKAKTLKNQWEALCASGRKLSKKRGFTEKDMMNAIYETRYNETA